MSYCGDYFSQADVSQRQSILVKNMQYMRENKRVSVCAIFKFKFSLPLL